jgi:hypothetical protein
MAKMEKDDIEKYLLGNEIRQTDISSTNRAMSRSS